AARPPPGAGPAARSEIDWIAMGAIHGRRFLVSFSVTVPIESAPRIGATLPLRVGNPPAAIDDGPRRRRARAERLWCLASPAGHHSDGRRRRPGTRPALRSWRRLVARACPRVLPAA